MNTDHVLIRKFNQLTLFLVGTLLLFSCIWAYFSNQALSREASTERANYIAGAISDSLTHAMDVGIPLKDMRGVDMLLRARVNENENIHHISVLNLAGAVIWQAEGSVQEAPPVQVTTDIRFQGHTIAYVQISVYPTGLGNMMMNAIFLQIVLCMMAYMACYEAIIFALGRGVILREQAKSKLQQSILQDQLNTVFIGQNRSNTDRVLYGMVQSLRRLNEKMWRMRRLTMSLRMTEPDADMRTELDTTLLRAEGQLNFADRKPNTVVLSAFSIDVRWLYFLTCFAVESLLQVMVPDNVTWMSPLLVLTGALGAIVGLLIGQKMAIRSSGQFLIMLGAIILFFSFIIVGIWPLTLYSVLARGIVYMGATIVMCGGYGVVGQTEESQAHWPIAAVTGGLIVGRLFSLLALEWFGSRMLVVCGLLLILVIIFLTNKFSWGQTDIWRRPLGKLVKAGAVFTPVSLCNGILSGLLFSFALATFVFNEGYGNEMIVTLSWFFLGVGAWFGYQLSSRWRIILWGLAFFSTLLLMIESYQINALNLLFCFSVSALDWHIRQDSQGKVWMFNLSELIGISLGASIYFALLYYSPPIDMPTIFLLLIVLLGVFLFIQHKQFIQRIKG